MTSRLKHLFILTTLLTLTTIIISAQAPSLQDVRGGSRFVSTTERYSIPAPRRISNYLVREKVGLLRDGTARQTSWALREGSLDIVRIDYPRPVIAANHTLAEYVAAEKRHLAEVFKDHRMVSEANVVSAGVIGVELVYVDRRGRKTIRRIYPTGNFEYIVEATITGGVTNAEKLIRAAMDSFLIIAPGKVASELERFNGLKDDNLKGRVRAVIEELAEAGSGPRKKVSETYYDKERGDKTRFVWYGGTGGVQTDHNFLADPFNGNVAKTSMEFSATTGAFNSLEFFELIHARDSADRITSEIEYGVDMKQRTRAEYTYSDNIIKVNFFNGDDKKTHAAEITLDKDGFPARIAYTTLDQGTPPAVSITDFTYDAFDSKGNWTKRTSIVKDKTYVNTRTITYWE